MTNTQLYLELKGLVEKLNAHPESVRLILQNNGVPVTGRVPNLYDVYVASKSNPTFLADLANSLNITVASADGTATTPSNTVVWGSAISSALSSFFSAYSDATTPTNANDAVLAALLAKENEAKLNESSTNNTMKYIAIGFGVVIVLVIVVFVLNKSKKQ